MNNLKKVMRILTAVLFCILCALPVCAEEPEYKSCEEMGGATVGLLTGMPFEDMITQKIPDIGGFSYFASMPDETLALKANKIDAIFINNALIDFAAAHNPELVKMSEHYLDSNFGFAFPKEDPQRDVWGSIIDRMKEDGTIDKLWEKWMLSDSPEKKVPQQDWPGNAGTVRVACADSFLRPYLYQRGSL